MTLQPLYELTICIKGAGEMASGIACRLHSANFKRIVMLEIEKPLAVRRKVSFCEAIYDQTQTVEGISAVKVSRFSEVKTAWENNKIAVICDPHWETAKTGRFDVMIDAILAKQNLGTGVDEALLVIGLGPGFTAGSDVHRVVETNRGHNLGRVITKGAAEPNTGIPGKIGNVTSERVIRAPAAGEFVSKKSIGDMVSPGDLIGTIDQHRINAEIGGVVRGLIRDYTPVNTRFKLGDIDPRGELAYCRTVSEKARAIGGAVLETILARFNQMP